MFDYIATNWTVEGISPGDRTWRDSDMNTDYVQIWDGAFLCIQTQSEWVNQEN
jgi:hypothetical protein